MAAYPSFTQLVGSGRTLVDDVTVDRAVSGAAKVRAFATGRKWKFKLKHELSASDLSTLLTFYDTNRLLTVTMTWTQTTTAYTVLFDGPPALVPVEKGYTEVTVDLVEQ